MSRNLEHGRLTGFYKAQVKLRRIREAAERASAEINAYFSDDSIVKYFKPRRRILVRANEQDDSIATSQDIENRKTEQLETVIWMRHIGRETLQLARHRIKHRDEIRKLIGDSNSGSEASLSA